MAAEAADLLNEDGELLRSVTGSKPTEPEDTFEWEAARLIERLGGALEQIAGGAPEPQKIATSALDAVEIAKTISR